MPRSKPNGSVVLRWQFIGLVIFATAALVSSGGASAQPNHYSLESVAGLRLHNVTAEPVVLDGKRGIRVQMSEGALRTFQALPQEGQQRATQRGFIEELAVLSSVRCLEIAHGRRNRANRV